MRIVDLRLKRGAGPPFGPQDDSSDGWRGEGLSRRARLLACVWSASVEQGDLDRVAEPVVGHAPLRARAGWRSRPRWL
jgi:hypothetical protein